jgi:cyclase
MKSERKTRSSTVDFVEVAEDIFAALTPYNGISWANAGCIKKGKGMVIDTFADLPHAQKLKDFMTNFNDQGPAYVINTHADMDHYNGNQLFNNSTIIAHQNFFKDYNPGRMDFWRMVQKEGLQSGKPGLVFLAENIDGLDFTGVKPIPPNITFNENMTIFLDDTKVEIKYIGPAHSFGDLLVWLPKEKVLFTGDILFEGVIGWSEKGLKGWIGVLDYIFNDLKPNNIIPGHGGICNTQFVNEMKNYFQNVVDTISKYYSDDITDLELAKKVDLRDYMHWIQPERVFVTVSTAVKERRGIPITKDWDYFAKNMAELREYHQKVYGNKGTVD